MRRNALLIVDTHHEKVGTIRDHVNALMACPDYAFAKIDYKIADRLNFAVFDVVVLHYSIVIAYDSYVSRRLREKLARFPGLKILFIQDEYRWIDLTANAIRELGVSVVFSLCRPSIVRQVYHHAWCDNVRFEYTLTGFVPQQLCERAVPDYAARRLDVAYRARKLNSWMGYHTVQKWQIAERFLPDAGAYGLKVDISTREEDRVYGEAWINMVSSARAVLGTESGASVCDFTGNIQREAEAYLAKFPDTTYVELAKRFFPDADGKIVMNVISPRCFEAAALRTLMIMYEGDYGGILEPGRHYIKLETDHSNMDDVVGLLRSPYDARRIIETTYREIATSSKWDYGSLTNHLARVLGEERPISHSLGIGARGSAENADLLATEVRLAALSARQAAEAEVRAVQRKAWAIRARSQAIARFEALGIRVFGALPAPLARRIKPSVRWAYFGVKNALGGMRRLAAGIRR